MYYFNPYLCVKSIFSYILILLIFFASQDIMVSFLYTKVMYASYVSLLFIGMIILAVKKKIDKVKLLVFLSFLVCLLLAVIVNLDFSGYSLVLSLFVALFFTEFLDVKDFFYKIDRVLFLLVCCSIISWLFVNLGSTYLLENIPKIKIPYFKEECILYNFGFSYISVIKNGFGFRNYGFFREPAMFCIYIGIALSYQLLVLNSKNFFRIIIYIFAIITTGSATGFIACIFLFFVYFSFTKMKITIFRKYVVLLLLFFIVAIKFEIWNYLFNRIGTTGDSAVSSLSRYYSISIGTFIGIIHPFGAGAVNSQILFENICEYLNLDSICWANMVTYLYAAYGFVFISIFLYGIYKFYNIFLNKKMSFFALIFICLLLCGEIMTYSSIMYIFVFYGYKYLKSSNMVYFLRKS